MGIRNARTTHPRKASRRAAALERFTVKRDLMESAAYMAAKLREFLALGGREEQFQYLPQRLGRAS